MTKTSKERLDQILVDQNLVETRSQAKSLILAGKVLVNEEVIDKAGTLVDPSKTIRIKEYLKYVSRGGLKMEKALQEFKDAIQIKGCVCLDIGASTGGFTDCLLQNGATKVYAIDVGYGQMHWKLQKDERVIRIDRENFRHFDIERLTDPISLCVIDVSFISIKLMIPKLLELFKTQNTSQAKTLVGLVKPQFEVGKSNIGKGGIVTDDHVRNEALNDVQRFLETEGFKNIKTTTSPITGAGGNIEFLICAHWDRN